MNDNASQRIFVRRCALTSHDRWNWFFDSKRGTCGELLWSSKSADPEYFNGQLSGRAVDTGEYL